jgi:hypothetical protein
VNHVDTVLKSDSDDIILSEISSNWSHTLSDHITLIRLVSMSVHPVLVRVDGDSRHCQLVCSSENSNSDFTTVGNEDLLERTGGTSLLLSQAGDAIFLAQTPRVQIEDSRLHVVRGSTRGRGKGVINVEVRLPCLVLWMGSSGTGSEVEMRSKAVVHVE